MQCNFKITPRAKLKTTSDNFNQVSLSIFIENQNIRILKVNLQFTSYGMKQFNIKYFSTLYFKHLPIKIHTATVTLYIKTTAITTNAHQQPQPQFKTMKGNSLDTSLSIIIIIITTQIYNIGYIREI